MSTPHYLDQAFNWQSKEVVDVYDDLPIWSSYAGNLLLNNLMPKPDSKVLDIGYGTGFPLVVLADRHGPNAQLFGIDLWKEAAHRTQQKLNVRNIHNVKLLDYDNGNFPLGDQSLDVITSNLAINNFDSRNEVLRECYRTLRPTGHLWISTNLKGTFQSFYDVMSSCIAQLNDSSIQEAYAHHLSQRVTRESLLSVGDQAGFNPLKTFNETASMNFANGTAFLNDYFIIMSFLPSWKLLIPESLQRSFFTTLEQELNQLAEANGGLQLDVPLTCIQFQKK